LLGLNGPQGNANATATLQNTPGYQFALDAGNQSVLRNQAATGQLASGATDVDLQKQGQGTALNSAYAPYLQALQQYLPFATQNAQGQGALYSGLAGRNPARPASKRRSTTAQTRRSATHRRTPISPTTPPLQTNSAR